MSRPRLSAPRRRVGAAVALASLHAGALAFACGGGEASRPEVTSPSISSAAATPAPPPPLPRAEPRDAGGAVTQWSTEEPVVHVPAPRVVPEPELGASEPIRPGDPHAFRLAAAVRAMRASPSGAKIVKMLSVIPDVIDTRTRTGVEPFEDGEWLLVYGSRVGVPGPNANVVKHARPDSAVAKALTDGGFEPWDAGSAPGAAPGTAGAMRGEMYGVRDVLLRPQPGVIAFVPADRARELAAVLARPIDPGVKPGELARILVAEPAKLARLIPSDVVKATIIVKPASDGGLDLSAEAACPSPTQCATIAADLDQLAKRNNSIVVRIATKNVLGGLIVRADGGMLRAMVHVAPDQLDAMLNLLRVQLGLPGPDLGNPTHP